MSNIVQPIGFLTFAIACFSLCFLFVDSLMVRIEMKTVLKALGFCLFGIGSFLIFFDPFVTIDLSLVSIILISISLYAIFLSFIIDAYSKFQWGIIVAIIALLFLRGHDLLTLQAGLIALNMFQLAYTTKHRDIIPLCTGFVLITIAEFFYSLETKAGFKGLGTAGAFLYLFAGVALLFWLWSYLKIRFFNLGKRSSFSLLSKSSTERKDNEDDEENTY